MAQIIEATPLLRERCMVKLSHDIFEHGRKWTEAKEDSPERWIEEAEIGKLIVNETARSIYDIPKPLHHTPHIYIIGLLQELVKLPEYKQWNWDEFFTLCVARYYESVLATANKNERRN